MQPSIAIIEDDHTIAFALSRYLETKQYHTRTFRSLRATESVAFDTFDLILLDLQLPDGSGFDLLDFIRKDTATPVIILTVQDSEPSVLEGLRRGADDYIAKPFSLPILKARIDAVLRRSKGSDFLRYGDLLLDREGKHASLSGIPLHLSRQEYELLELLVDEPNRQFLRSYLIDSIWKENYEINDNTLTVTVKRIREKLGENYARHLQTVRGIGYVWHDEV